MFRYKYFRSGIIYVQNWRVCELLKCILAIQKQLMNRPTSSNNKSDRPQVKICDTWKTLKYLNIKRIKRIKFVVLLLIVVLFDFLNIKSVKIYAIPMVLPYIFSTTLLLYKLDTLLLKQMNFPILDITGFFFRICTQVMALVLCTSAFTWVLMRKRNLLYPIQAASFVSMVLYPILNQINYMYVYYVVIYLT
jgi:hypothetical protein